ncbi:hypothetical protein BCR33DRAFT_742715 [Rhizoclosmatium globosum]|uniref:Glycoside hydrolase n=1 Tax=Rhizoclosmatium globosum TaxID=329046 RepID=A0A1Y2BQL8_9FUNG|nr:hypothetical protein BCR33DRAFT_742715 [Rhizoclosmatium globosum]|eukprot:ORY36445.1 hypothetical protein BCR33DRAFT_742715 [Rhizoclosmatium globosum]
MHGIVSLTTLATYVSLLAAISASAATNTTFSKDGANVIVLSPGYIPPTIFRGPRDPKTFKISTANGPLPNLVYSGGPIIRNVTVQPIFYGNINFAPQITAFYQGVTQSSWMDLLAQYGTWGGTSLSPLSVSATIDFSKGYITDQDIQDYLKRLVRSGAILPTVNMYFPIHFPSGIRIQSGRDGNNNPQYSCTNFCGYHGAIDVSDPSANLGLDFKVNTQTQFLYYGVMPDITDSTCACHNTPNRGYLADALSVAAHELAEAATDGVPSLQYLGWYDFNITPGGEEIADICAWKFDKTLSRFDGKSYDVQQLWSNNDAGCMTAGSTAQADPAIGTGCYPAFDVSQAYIPGSVASRVDPKNPSVFYNIKRDVSGWIQGSVCNQKLNTACYPTYKCDNVSSVDGTQVWCGSTNAIRKGTALNSIGICVVYPSMYLNACDS